MRQIKSGKKFAAQYLCCEFFVNPGKTYGKNKAGCIIIYLQSEQWEETAMATIYIVEDDVNIREIERYALKNSGYHVEEFAINCLIFSILYF